MSDKYYEVNLIATAVNFYEALAEEYDSEPNPPSQKEIDKAVINALSKVGFMNIDPKKLELSMEYYFQESDEDITAYEGYSTPFPD